MAVIARSASASVEKLRREAIFQATLNAIATKNEIIQSPRRRPRLPEKSWEHEENLSMRRWWWFWYRVVGRVCRHAILIYYNSSGGSSKVMAKLGCVYCILAAAKAKLSSNFPNKMVKELRHRNVIRRNWSNSGWHQCLNNNHILTNFSPVLIIDQDETFLVIF